ncbi:ABC transporter permease [Nonomuraea sp. NPDC003707]
MSSLHATRLPKAGRLRAVAGSPAVVSVAGALMLTTLVMVVSGVDPALAYPALIRGALMDGNLEYTVAAFVPTLGMAMAFAIPLRAGEFNLGGDGQLALGGIAAAAIALHAGGSFVLPLVGAAVAGGLLAAVSAPLRTRFGVPAIVSTLLLSAPAVSLASYLARFPLAERGTGLAQTPLLPEATRLPALGSGAYVTIGLPVVAVLAAAWLYGDARTVPGYEIRAMGAGREFARYGGVRVNRLAAVTLAAGGALAGLVGGLIVLGPPYRFVDGALTAPGYTFTAIAAVLLATGRPPAIPVSVGLLTILQAGGQGMEREVGVPSQLMQIVQGLIIVIVAVAAVVRGSLAGRRP